MSAIHVKGCGAVSPAGWGAKPLCQALARAEPLPVRELARPAPDASTPQGQVATLPGWGQHVPLASKPLRVRTVPPPGQKPAFMGHPRLRRTSPITQYTVAAALEALGPDAARVRDGSLRLGIVFCVMAGCVNYSRRFYDEILKDPATASPLVFPETVLNAPASHLASFLGTSAINYTLVGDPGAFLQGLALGADWLVTQQVDACLVLAAEEIDWLVAEATNLFSPEAILSEGAGALYLGSAPAPIPITLRAITDAQLFWDRQTRAAAAQRARMAVPSIEGQGVLCDGCQGNPKTDLAELTAWSDWAGRRISPKRILGEAFTATAAWQCIAAVDALTSSAYAGANVSVLGTNQQAIAAQFIRAPQPSTIVNGNPSVLR